MVAAFAATALMPSAGDSQGPPPSLHAPSPIAQLGVELPTLGGGDWWTVKRKKYFTEAAMADIRYNLHATYVRTGWIPHNLTIEIRWRREDDGMDLVCRSGLQLLGLLPGPAKEFQHSTTEELAGDVREFCARYTVREPGCIRYAEAANEADLTQNRFADVSAYAAYYRSVAPVVASFGIPVITSGVSGQDLPWTYALASLLRESQSPVNGFGFHPYGVPPARVAEAVTAMARAAGSPALGTLPHVYVTEIGQADPRDLYATIVNLAHVTPTITIYEYQAQPGEDPRYGLKNNPALYAAMQRAWATLEQPAP